MPNTKPPKERKPSLKDARADQVKKLSLVIDQMQSKLKKLRDERLKQRDLLKSETEGLYEELDKLSKKAPAEEVTGLALDNINYVINETRKFLESDAIIQRIKPFVPAGDNPQLRDAVLVLRQITQGLQRYDKDSIPRTDKLTAFISEATALRGILKIFVENNYTVDSRRDSHYSGTRFWDSLHDDWFSVEYPYGFLYEKLDALDVDNYFSERE